MFFALSHPPSCHLQAVSHQPNGNTKGCDEQRRAETLYCTPPHNNTPCCVDKTLPLHFLPLRRRRELHSALGTVSPWGGWCLGLVAVPAARTAVETLRSTRPCCAHLGCAHLAQLSHNTALCPLSVPPLLSSTGLRSVGERWSRNIPKTPLYILNLMAVCHKACCQARASNLLV